ncbi:MAG: peptide chain release factor N(5)-glutamine methyltransferase [Acidobacteriota bacterium]
MARPRGGSSGAPVTVADLLRQAAARMRPRVGLENPAREARWLLAAVLGRQESWLLAHPDDEVRADAVMRFNDVVARRDGGEPAHAILGECPFWGRPFLVSPDVLIPRPETELLVERALTLPVPSDARIVDVGTGSGCIAISVALERPRAQVVATEFSLPAVQVAARNAARLGANVTFACGDLARHLRGPFHLVVANLPYIPSAQLAGLAPEIRGHEPRVAFDGGIDGDELLRALVVDLPRLLGPAGLALMEVGPGHAALLEPALHRVGLAIRETVTDLSGVARVIVVARLSASGGAAPPGSGVPVQPAGHQRGKHRAHPQHEHPPEWEDAGDR